MCKELTLENNHLKLKESESRLKISEAARPPTRETGSSEVSKEDLMKRLNEISAQNIVDKERFEETIRRERQRFEEIIEKQKEMLEKSHEVINQSQKLVSSVNRLNRVPLQKVSFF